MIIILFCFVIISSFQTSHIQDYPVLTKKFHVYEDDDWSGEYNDYRDGCYYNYLKSNGKYMFEDDLFWGGIWSHGVAPVTESPSHLVERACPGIPVGVKIDDNGDFKDISFNFCDNNSHPKSTFIDQNGNELTDYEFDEIRAFNDDFAVVGKRISSNTGDGNIKYGYLNSDLQQIIPLEYDYADSFHNNMAVVSKFSCNESDKCSNIFYLVDKSGRKVSFNFNMIFNHYGSGYVKAVKDNTSGYLTLDGKWLCRNCGGSNIINNRSCVFALDKYQSWHEKNICPMCSIMDEHGKIISPYQISKIDLDIHDYEADRIEAMIKFDSLRTPDAISFKKKIVYFFEYLYEYFREHLIKNEYIIFQIEKINYLTPECGISKKIPYSHVIIDHDAKIVWPPGWNDPCTDTAGVIVWPEGACDER